MRPLLRLLSFLILFAVFTPSHLEAQTHYVAFLTSSEEQPAAPVGAFGYGLFTLSADRTQLTYQIAAWGLSGPIMGSHFHTAARGLPGRVRRGITFTDNGTATGVWSSTDETNPLSAEVLDSLFAGKLYVNIHTLINPNGEIRGQLFIPTQTLFAAATADQETDASTGGPTNVAAAFFIYDSLHSIVFYRGQVGPTTSQILNAHVHQGDSGVSGGVLVSTPIDTIERTMIGYWPETGSQTEATIADLLGGHLYWNIHTRNNPNGEMRGQITKGFTDHNDSGMFFIAPLSGSQEGGDGIPSTAKGTAFFHLSPDFERLRMIALYSGLTSPLAGGHIHNGMIGQTGNVLAPFVTLPGSTQEVGGLAMEWNTSTGLTPAWIDSLFNGGIYANIHSSQFPGGEIRGQVIPVSQRFAPVASVPKLSAHTFQLEQNYPNPFNPSTVVRYSLTQPSDVVLDVYTQIGTKVFSINAGKKEPGEYQATIDLAQYPSGVYFTELKTVQGMQRIKMILAK